MSRIKLGKVSAAGDAVIGDHNTIRSHRGSGAPTEVDLSALKNELSELRAAMKQQATDPEHDIAVAEVASAEVAAGKEDESSVLDHLAKAGKWALGIATTIGATVAAAAIRSAIGV